MDTTNQKTADGFDLEIFRLLRRSEAYANESRGETQRSWRRIAQAISLIRPIVRDMMSKEARDRSSPVVALVASLRDKVH